MIHIAHISDIHFGNKFSETTWAGVVDAVAAFDPHLIVVSGDLVDDPWPAHLLAAKCGLSQLLEKVHETSNERWHGKGRGAELIVIPGNHDVYESGVAFWLKRLDWFERIFHVADTAKAEAALKEKLKVGKLGFNSICLGYAAGTKPGRVRKFLNRLKAAGLGRLILERFTTHLPARKAATEPDEVPRFVRTPASAPVLITLLDSNPTRAGFHTATGVVEDDDLLRLQTELRKTKGTYVARIAIVHHHVLPIAFAAGVSKLTGEPMMVLRNAGAVLQILADNKFDLVLHGHWHKSQFARIDFGSDSGDSYSMAVASAGSAAMKSDSISANSLNLITISPIGRIEVQSVPYGAAKLPTPTGKHGQDFHTYKEPLSAAKYRSYTRARERHPIECEKREQAHEITENGDLWVTHALTDFRAHGTREYVRRPFIVNIPAYGHFVHSTLKLDEDSVWAGASLDRADGYPERKQDEPELEHYWLNLPKNWQTEGTKSFTYTIRHGCANCMNMTYWEALERARHATDQLPPDYDREMIGARIVFPVRKLVLKVRFPQSLTGVQPRVECLRPVQFPAYETDEFGDAEPHGEREIDPEAQDEEQRNLRYEAETSTWILDVERPIVGYQYALSWQLPSDAIDTGIKDNAREWQRVLLKLGDRIDAGTTTANDREAIRQFDLLCKTLEVEVRETSPGEKQTVALLIYDSERLALRPVFSRRSWISEPLSRDFGIPYGDGVSGAAFQQRRIIAWSRGEVTSDPKGAAPSLITPVDYPDASDGTYDALNVLALPVYDVGSEDGRPPPPWAAIGVVTIDSSSYACPIKDMNDRQLLFLRALMQAQMDKIVRAVRGE